MEVFKLFAFAIIAAILVIAIKDQRKDIAIVLSISAGIALMIFSLGKVSDVVNLIQELILKTGVNAKFLEIILKVTAISYLIEFGKNICIDAGESAIASKLEMAGKVTIVSLSIPIFTALLTMITTLV